MLAKVKVSMRIPSSTFDGEIHDLILAGKDDLMVAGVIYAWSILKAPLAEEFGWSGSELALNFTLTMCFYCLGGFFGGLFSKRLGSRISLLAAAVLSGLGFFLTSRLSGGVVTLYLSYGVIAAFGIGISYNVIISTVSAWFPDQKGLCSGALLMGFLWRARGTNGWGAAFRRRRGVGRIISCCWRCFSLCFTGRRRVLPTPLFI